jgi:hypothetical protein
MGLHETKKILPSKGNSLQMDERTHKIGENLCQPYIWQGINNQNTQGAQKLNLSKNEQPHKWMANELNRQFSKVK